MKPYTCPSELITNRLLLRALQMNDVDFIFEEWSDPEVTRYMWDEEPLKSREESVAFLSTLLSSDKTSNTIWWGIELRTNNSLIGTCGYFRWDHQHHRAEIGYDLCPEVWRQGLMSEALQAIIRYGFEEMMLNRIEAMTHIENHRSQKVLMKLGFQKEGLLREYFCRYGIYGDQVQYSLLKSEWQ